MDNNDQFYKDMLGNHTEKEYYIFYLLNGKGYTRWALGEQHLAEVTLEIAGIGGKISRIEDKG